MLLLVVVVGSVLINQGRVMSSGIDRDRTVETKGQNGNNVLPRLLSYLSSGY